MPEAQVYAGFIRDGVNFGPGSTGGDNNQPGYFVDIVGLKSVFTNGPFAVQLIASSDSMQYLTNAFIIDATLNSTQSVTYPNPQVYGNGGGTTWFRAIGGGLSTGSGSVDTDHLKIIGNRAAHSAGPPAYNFASTISGAIITDKPVISMPPNPVVVSTGDTITWNGYAVGVPPLSYQWLHNGVPIPGANTNSYSIAKVGSGQQGSYDMVVSNAYGSASSRVFVDQIIPMAVTNLVLDSNPNGTEHDGLNFGATWLASDGTHSGVMSFNATNQNQIVVPGQTNFDYGAGTLTFWMRSPGPTNSSGQPAMLLDRRTSSGLVVVLQAGGQLEVQTSGSPSANDATSSSSVLTNNAWHQISVVFSVTNSDSIVLYIDGTLDSTSGNTADWSWPRGQELELGLSHDTKWQAYQGLLDDMRFYNRPLTATEVASIASSGALVDTNALVMRLNFDTAPTNGLSLQWRVPDAILQSSDSAAGPYTDTPSVASPYPFTIKGAIKFFRYHGHTPTNIVSNPYLM